MSLFSGIAGLDLGLEMAGHPIAGMCESWEPARSVLRAQFPTLSIHPDVRTFTPYEPISLLTAGFPCVDLSHAGGKAGIFGPQSGLVEHVFRIAKAAMAEWVVIENVPNLLSLHKGAGIRHITAQLEVLGYRWAYRLVDARFTGLPQRRHRVLVVASRTGNPAGVLLGEDAGERSDLPSARVPSGFYWTEGRRGVGFVHGAVPTLKGGSTLGLPSAPAVWVPDAACGNRFVLPSVDDGEALQGFPAGWTDAALRHDGPDHRWKLIGNAVPVPVALWLGERLAQADHAPPVGHHPDQLPLDRDGRWPRAAWGDADSGWVSSVSEWPRHEPLSTLGDLIKLDTAVALSHRAAKGFLSRLEESGLQVPPGFLADLKEHVHVTRLTSRKAAATSARGITTVSLDTEKLPAGSWASSPQARRRMRANRRRDTMPELLLRRELHALGLRYRIHTRPASEHRHRLDIVIRPAKVAVDVRGCFWHACPQHATSPRTNADRWAAKLARKVERDREIVDRLRTDGWEVIVVWEHDDPLTAAARIAEIVQERRSIL